MPKVKARVLLPQTGSLLGKPVSQAMDPDGEEFHLPHRDTVLPLRSSRPWTRPIL